MEDEKNSQNATQKAVPSSLSDHDEEDETMATDLPWDREDDDALTTAQQRLDEFKKDGVPLSDEDWEDEEDEDDEIPDHIESAIDESLEEGEKEV